MPLAVLDGQNELFCDAAIPGNWDLANTLQGGKKPYVFALKDEVGNALPDNLELSEAGVLEGTVSTAGVYTFKVVVTDALEEVLEVEYTLEVQLSKTTGEDGPDATVLMGYPTEISLAADIRGGTAPYTFEFEDGSLPSGMTLNGTKLSGIPTMTGNSYFWL